MAAPSGNSGFCDRRSMTPMERFLSFCRFDPGTGCVIWTGGQTSGRGHRSPYGAFWFEGRRWFAHRWAAKHIHGHDINGLQVEHYCPNIDHPDTLCVEHVHPVPGSINRELQALRARGECRDAAERMKWIFVQIGIEVAPPARLEAFTEPPFYEAPTWLSRCPLSPANIAGSINLIVQP